MDEWMFTFQQRSVLSGIWQKGVAAVFKTVNLLMLQCSTESLYYSLQCSGSKKKTEIWRNLLIFSPLWRDILCVWEAHTVWSHLNSLFIQIQSNKWNMSGAEWSGQFLYQAIHVCFCCKWVLFILGLRNKVLKIAVHSTASRGWLQKGVNSQSLPC